MAKMNDQPIAGTITGTGTALGVTEDLTGGWITSIQISGLTTETINVKAKSGSITSATMKWTDGSTGAVHASGNMGNGFFYVQAPFSRLSFTKSSTSETALIAYICV